MAGDTTRSTGDGAPLPLCPFGANDTPIWGMRVDERLRRIARAQRRALGHAGGEGPALLTDRRFVFDPAWTTIMAARPGEALALGGEVVIAHCLDADQRRAVAEGHPPGEAGLRTLHHEAGDAFVNEALRKREVPFAMRLTPETASDAERASYVGAYKGVTDLLTKYLWPEWALALTRLAARIGLTPNMVTSLGAVLCVLATIWFWQGHYWWGMAAGLVFMVLDTVDGKLARCTITSSKLGNAFDHGIDLVHPLIWWWAWAHGLAAWGQALDGRTFAWTMGVLVAGYVVQRLIEGEFIRRFGMHIHVWRKFDSDFRLITARRNPNMVILFAATLAGRPDIGILAVAWWTALSCGIHLVRLGQAMLAPKPLRSWLA